MESPKALPSFTAQQPDRGMADRFSYDGIAEGASVVYRELIAV